MKKKAKKVLIVDDNSTNLYMLKCLLEGEGLEVIAAENGKEALERAYADPPDLIVTDILMPVMDGYNLCREWKSDDTLKHIPLVFYTATYTGSKNEDFALGLGADRFILKPQEPDILINILKEVLEENYVVKQVATKPLEEEMEFFRQYNEILFKKLEKKMLDLEIANQELRILEERYRLSFEHVMDVIYTIDTDLNFISISPSVERILGYKPQDFIGRPVSDVGNILMPESFEQAVADISLVLKGDTISATVYRFIAKDGTIKYGEVSGSPVMRDGKIIGIISVARDITDRKLVEKKLRESEKKYRDLFDFLPIPVYEMDFEANIISANRSIYETFGGSEEDLKKGFKAWQLLSPEAIDKSSKNIERLLKGEQVGGTEYTLKRLDGSVFPGIVISSVIYSNDKPVGLRGAIVDITQRKRAEEALENERTLLRNLIDNVPDRIYAKDSEGRFIICNEAMIRRMGMTSMAELAGKSDFDLLPLEMAQRFHADEQAIIQSGTPMINREEPLTTEGGKITRWNLATKVPLLDKQGNRIGIVGVGREITDLKQAEQKLKDTLESLRKAVGTTIQVMVSAVETRDPYTAGHQTRSADLARYIATEMGLPQEKIDGIRMAGSIHDIGKLSIPAEILSKPTKLTDIEFSLIQLHARKGYEILKDVESSWPLAEMVYQHHERMDGSGYPRNLKGEEILIEARILAVADVVESMASHRPYRPSLGIRAALDEIAKNRGVLYDPEVVDACLKLFHEKGYSLH
ncbi:MAG: PAS domain S-box protein [Deltaproteobacteria bacterium]|nr:PAS domain S-box protein [Deltaproteobacteria bacterium]